MLCNIYILPFLRTLCFETFARRYERVGLGDGQSVQSFPHRRYQSQLSMLYEPRQGFKISIYIKFNIG